MTQHVPTAPGALPLVGHTLALLRQDRLEYLSSLRRLGDLVRIRIGTRRFLLLNSPGLVRAVMIEEGRSFDRGRIFDKARPYVGDGLFTAEGAEHHRQRRMVQPAFHRDHLNRCLRVMTDVAHRHVEAWRHGATIGAEREMHVLASEIVGRTMFRAPQAAEVVELARDELPALLRGLGRRTLLPDLLNRVPTPVGRRFDTACARLRDAAGRLVAHYRAGNDDLGDFVSMLLLARDARTGTTMTDDEIRDQVMTLLISGIETPATLLTWALYELARHPELRPALGDDGFLEAFVRESLRLHHPLWLLMRRAVTPVTIGGVRLAPGDEVVYSPAVMHRDPTVFTEPLRFDPYRWLGDAPDAKMYQAFVPFGLGGRQCVGDMYAWMMLKTVIAAVAATGRLSLPAGFRPRTVITGIVHLAELPLIVEARDHDKTARG